MGLRESDVIDMLMEPPPFATEPAKLWLMIIDATSEIAEEDRYQLLLRKLAGYMVYVQSPEFRTAHPGIAAADVLVKVLTVMPPSAAMLNVEAINTKDRSARIRVSFDDYHMFMKRVRGTNPPGPANN